MADAVIDASVAVKLLIRGEHADRARRLLASVAQSGQQLSAPTLLPGEVTNALYQQVRRRGIMLDEARTALARFEQVPIRLIHQHSIAEQAFAFAEAYSLRAVYDSFYVVLARLQNAGLWTDDRRLLREVGPVAPWVRWIGDNPLAGGYLATLR